MMLKGTPGTVCVVFINCVRFGRYELYFPAFGTDLEGMVLRPCE